MSTTEPDLSGEQELLSALRRKEMKAFVQLYKTYSEDLLICAYFYLRDRRQATQTIVRFFEDLWEGTDFMEICPPIYPYLFEQLRKICMSQHTE